jgi:hypothetical protein
MEDYNFLECFKYSISKWNEFFPYENKISWVWLSTLYSQLRRLRQEDREFETSLGHLVIPCLEQRKK